MSSINSLFVVDIKSIIAFSTVGQISYVLLISLVYSSLSIFHVFIHSFYKSMLFLLSSELIHHQQGNSQSVYQYHVNNSLIRIYYITAGIALLFALTKEGILHAIIQSSILLFPLLLLSSIISIIYVSLILSFLLLYNSR